MAGLRIDARGHESGRCGNHGECGFRIDEVVELQFAFVVVAGDAHDVLAVCPGEIRIGIDQRLAHALGVLDVLAKYDRLGEAVGGLEKLCHLGGHDLRALIQHEIAVVIQHVVFAVFDLLSVPVSLPLFRTPSFEVLVQSRSAPLCRARESRPRFLAAENTCRSDRRNTRCWKLLWFPSAWRSYRSASPTRNNQALFASQRHRPRCPDDTHQPR